MNTQIDPEPYVVDDKKAPHFEGLRIGLDEVEFDALGPNYGGASVRFAPRAGFSQTEADYK